LQGPVYHFDVEKMEQADAWTKFARRRSPGRLSVCYRSWRRQEEIMHPIVNAELIAWQSIFCWYPGSKPA
jgi:hypothetical protein